MKRRPSRPCTSQDTLLGWGNRLPMPRGACRPAPNRVLINRRWWHVPFYRTAGFRRTPRIIGIVGHIRDEQSRVGSASSPLAPPSWSLWLLSERELRLFYRSQSIESTGSLGEPSRVSVFLLFPAFSFPSRRLPFLLLDQQRPPTSKGVTPLGYDTLHHRLCIYPSTSHPM